MTFSRQTLTYYDFSPLKEVTRDKNSLFAIGAPLHIYFYKVVIELCEDNTHKYYKLNVPSSAFIIL